MERINHKSYNQSNAGIIKYFHESRDISYLRGHLSELKELEKIIEASSNVQLKKFQDNSNGRFISVTYILDYLLEYNDRNIKKSLIKEGFEDSIAFRAPNFKMTCFDQDSGLKYYNVSYITQNNVNIGIRFYEQKKKKIEEQG